MQEKLDYFDDVIKVAEQSMRCSTEVTKSILDVSGIVGLKCRQTVAEAGLSCERQNA